MKPEKLQSHVSKQIAEIKDNAVQILDGDAVDAVHEFRVAYKKLRTLLRLSGVIEDAEKSRTIRKIKAIYRVAGELRDLQLYRAMILSYYFDGHALSIKYPDALNKKKDLLIHRLHQLISDDSIDLHSSALDPLLQEQLSQKTIRAFIDGQLHSIYDILNGKLTDSDIHVIRKYFKDVYYCLAYLRETRKSESYIKKEKKIEALNHALGEFVDTCTMQCFLGTDITSSWPAEELRILGHVDQHLLVHKELQKQHIEKLLRHV